MEATRIMMYKRKMDSLLRTHFSNDQLRPSPGMCWGPRSIPDIELILIHAGSLALHLEKQTVQAEENDLLIIFPGERHTLECLQENTSISCIHCDLPEAEAQSLSRVQRIKDPEIANGFRRCASAFMHPSSCRTELTNAILSEIWIRIRVATSPSERSHSSGPAEEIAQTIREHCCEPFDRTALAKRFHISPQHLNYLFRTQLHTTPTEVLHRERMKQAFLLMQNEHLSVKETAERTGFYDTYHFSKVFKKAYGIPPSSMIQFFKPKKNHS